MKIKLASFEDAVKLANADADVVIENKEGHSLMSVGGFLLIASGKKINPYKTEWYIIKGD